MASQTADLDPRAFGLACGLLWAAGVAFLGLLARVGWGRRWERLLADAYRGYDESASGIVIGALWAFIDGFSGGYAFAWLYDRLLPGSEVPATAEYAETPSERPSAATTDA